MANFCQVNNLDFSRAAAVILVFRSQVRGEAAIKPSFQISHYEDLSSPPW
jgi:hypothetical protein